MQRNKTPLPPLDAPSDRKTEFFMAASHQLKSPVAIVQWCLQSVLEDDTLNAANKSLAQRALGQANAMSSLLSDMLKVFRLVHSGKGSVARVPVDVNKLLLQVIEQYQPIAQQQQVHLLVGAIEKLPSVMADEDYLKQAFINLVDNAIKYTKERGKVEITAHATGKWVEVAVADSGIGIADVDQSRLFTEFFRSEAAKEKTHDGTGLGLVLVKHIVEGFGGEVRYKSVLGKGTTFTLRLPSASAGR